MNNDEHEKLTEDQDGDPSVPSDLLELHVALEENMVSPEEFREVYGK